PGDSGKCLLQVLIRDDVRHGFPSSLCSAQVDSQLVCIRAEVVRDVEEHAFGLVLVGVQTDLLNVVHPLHGDDLSCYLKKNAIGVNCLSSKFPVKGRLEVRNEFTDRVPARGDYEDEFQDTVRCSAQFHHPTLPSRLTPNNFCASTANSIGNSRN